MKRLLARHTELLDIERSLWRNGKRFVAGIDEVGTGSLAGPVFAACVVLDPERLESLVGVDDSKRLTPISRERLARAITRAAHTWGVAQASVEEVDRGGVLEATLLAMRRALKRVRADVEVDYLLIDARRLEDTQIPQDPLVKGDSRCLCIAAASILAKVARDNLMMTLSAQYPAYGFNAHKGYGTQRHLEALAEFGASPIHRRSFQPVSRFLRPTLSVGGTGSESHE